jgi:transcriptional regulator
VVAVVRRRLTWVLWEAMFTCAGGAMDLVKGYSFGTLVTAPDGEPIATHLPFAFLPDRGEYGSFFSHIARDSPQCRSFVLAREGGPLALLVFQGPHSYISPSWYDTDEAVVPTWNYMAIHVFGRPTVIEDPAEVRKLLEQTIAEYESEMAQPWSLDSQEEEYIERRIASMVAFEVPVERIETKARLGQNKPSELTSELTDWLEVQPDSMKRELARLMRAGVRQRER